ncbi:unnamed protein product, partial [Laminaria digitata]
AVAAVRGDGTYNIRYDNGEVDRLVRRADIFEVTNSPGRAPQGSMEREDKSCAGGGGVDAARYGPGDLRSRQKKKRKLERSEGLPLRSPDTPDTQPVREERTPARPALFQDEAWGTSDANVGEDTPSPVLAGTMEESTATRRGQQRRNQKRKIIVELEDESTSADDRDCVEPLPAPLPVPLPTTESPPAEMNDFATETCDVGPPHDRVNVVGVGRGDGGGRYHREALQTPGTPKLGGRVEAGELEGPGSGVVGGDASIDDATTANPKFDGGVAGMGVDSCAAVFLE